MDDLKSLSAIFQNRIFSIPDYQRGYAWQAEQIEDLIEDIEDLERIRAGRRTYMHFTGTVVLKEIADERGGRKTERVNGKNLACYEIVDGQQRLTSLVILLNEIAGAFRRGGHPWQDAARTLVETYVSLKDGTVWLFHLGKELNEFFRRCVVADGTPRTETESQERLVAAKRRFREYVARRMREADDPFASLDGLSETVTEALGFVLHEVKGEHEVSVIFETVNSRGRELTQFEKTKNLLFFLAGRTGDQDGLKAVSSRINDTWSYILRELHKGGREAKEDQFLRYHWAIFPGALWFDENRRDNTFDIHKAVKETSKTEAFRQDPIGWLTAYLGSLWTYVGVYCDVVSPRRDSAFACLAPETRNFVETSLSIDRIGREANLVPLLMAAYDRYKDTAPELLELFRLVESFSFRMIAQARYANVGRSTAFRLAAEIARGDHTVAAAKDNIRGQLINSYCNDKSFQDVMLDTGNWYDWSGIRYFLFEYECHRSKLTNRALPIDWDKFMAMEKDQTIEHILPQGENTLANPYWQSKFTNEEWEECRHRLGNLCISEHGANAGYGNRAFPEKCGHVPSGLKKTYVNSAFQSEKDLAAFSDWNPATIERRQGELAKFALERWKS